MSRYATQLDCLKARDKWFQERVAALEQKVNTYAEEMARRACVITDLQAELLKQSYACKGK